MKKVILLDIDGTLTNDDKIITEKTKEALIKVQQQGAVLVLASGRTTRGLLALAKQLQMQQHHGLLVSYNGGKVVDCESNEVLFDEVMTVEEVKAVLHHMKLFEVQAMIDHGDYMFLNDAYGFMAQYEVRGGGFLACEIKDMEAFIDFPVNKILTCGQPDYLKAHYQEMMEPFKDSLNCMFTTPFYFEFTAKGIDKAKAIAEVMEKRGFQKEDMIAFGDSHNDISMLSYAGVSVAMGNAVKEVKDIADMITSTNNEDGIAEALEKLLF